MKFLKYKNNEIGAKVIIPKLLKDIKPKDGWFYLKNVSGVIVKDNNYEQYYHSCDGGHNNKRKHIIENDCHPKYSIKLDNGVTDIEGNNIVVVREWDLKFLETKEIKNPISKTEYNKALKVIKEYENYSNLKNIGKW